ncbi:MAG TPA: deoxyribonuclease V [Anaerolineae bacterium]|nr:deoxyribonuclease V [Anaerolineae bacterium]
MDLAFQHKWDITAEEAKQLQIELASRVVRRDMVGTVRYVAGVDVAFFDEGRISQGAVVVLSWPELQIVAQEVARQETTFPYVPGFLSFREVPVLLAALAKLEQVPDLILCDGQGVAHPRRFGLACHLGVLTDIATIGVAKTRFIGVHEEVPVARGSSVRLVDSGEEVGRVVRTQAGVRPLYVSVGHKVSLETAVTYVLGCAPRFRLPETTRQADRLARIRL